MNEQQATQPSRWHSPDRSGAVLRRRELSSPRRRAGRLRAVCATALAAVLGAGALVPAYATTTTASVSDTFARTVASGWGAAETGGAWTTSGGVHSVVPGTGRQELRRAGQAGTAHLGGHASTSADVRVQVSLDKVPAGGSSFVSVVGRRVGTAGDYRARLRIQPSGAVTLIAARGETSLETVELPGAYTAGQRLVVRLQVNGTSPTTVRAKAWAVGTAEPAGWQVSATDSTSKLQQPGGVALSTYLGRGVSNTPVVTRFASLSATPVAPNRAPVPTFSRQVQDLTADVDGSGSSDVDGRVVSWAWSFGDGATATGPTARHTYSSAGTYPVTLTVTDDEGARSSTTSSVTVVAPNVAPVAHVATTTKDLAVHVDGTRSSDLDGRVVEWTWAFGDGATATGSTAQHTYAKPGTYTVALTVTDDRGAQARATATVTATAPTSAWDGFGRSVSSGWGSADVGGVWVTPVTSGSAHSVVPGVGRQEVLRAGQTGWAHLDGYAGVVTDLRVEVGLDKAPAGGNTFVSVVGRRVGTAGDYRARLRVQPSGVVTLIAARGETSLQAVDLAGSYVAGQRLVVRVQVNGASPTTVRAKAWPVGAVEPAAWQVSVTDATAELQQPGGVSVSTFISSAATNAPVVARFAAVQVNGVLAPAAAPAPAPVPGGRVKPDGSNTGVPAGIQLRAHHGDIVVTQPGTVIEGLDVFGFITVRTSDVTIRNTRVRGSGPGSFNTGLINANHRDVRNLVIEDVTLLPDFPSVWINGVIGHDFTARRVNASRVVDGFNIYNIHGTAANVRVESSYVHNLSYFSPDPNHSDNQTHNDAIQIQGGSNITIVGNTLSAWLAKDVGTQNYRHPQAGFGIIVTPNVNAVSNSRIENNWFDGSYIPLKIESRSKVGPMNVGRINRNRFARDMRNVPMNGVNQWFTILMTPDTTAETVGNVYDDDNSPVQVRRDSGTRTAP
jgi:PKD repeat protein